MTESSDYDSLQVTKVPHGITLVLCGIIWTALTSTSFLSFLTISRLFGELSLMGIAVEVGPVFYVGLYGGAIVGVVGIVLFLTVPCELQGMKGTVFEVVSGVLAHEIALPQKSTIAELLLVNAFGCFLLFLQHCGKVLHDCELGGNSNQLLRLGITLVAILSLRIVPRLVEEGFIFQLVAVFLGLIGLMRYLRLISDVKKKVLCVSIPF